MAHFAIICPEAAGHVLSVGPIGSELIRRGHRATLVAREKAAPLAAELNLEFYCLNVNDVPWRTSHLQWAAFWLAGNAWRISMRDNFLWQSRFLLEKLPAALRELGVDGAVVDQTLPAAGTAAQRAGLPFVTINSALLWNEEPAVPPPFTDWPYAEGRRAHLRNRMGYAAWHWFIRPVIRLINGYRRRWNLPLLQRIEDAFSPWAQVSQLCAGFDFPRREIPDNFHYIGSLASNRKAGDDFGFPWERLDGRPLIFASVGTVADSANPRVLKRIAQACDGLDAQLVLALGKWDDEGDANKERLGTLCGNHVLVDFAPQLALLDKAALLITHAGVNTVLEAICRAVPMVALPRGADQPGMAARVQYSGVGLCGSFWNSSPQEIQQLVRRVLADDAFRVRAAQMQQAMVAAGGLCRAAEIVEQAVITGRPVLRQ